jgi:GrpB-like predicted nucleotidyltransferase (UPF0157 family)
VASEIKIQPYQKRWSEEFLDIAALISSSAPPGAYIHHIGSTAVPGLAAKDIIDVQLTVDQLGDVSREKICDLDFEHVAHLKDHMPAGTGLSSADLNKLFFRSRRRAVHLHIRERGCFNQRYALLCRDFLRENASVAAAYAAAKIALAERTDCDVETYYAIKDPIFDIIMAGAELWARDCGWTEPSPDWM